MQQQLCLLHFLQRGAEAGYKRVGQVANKSHGVRQQHFATAGQLDCAQLGVKCGEHARRLEHMAAGDAVEKRALACVGVSDQGNRGNGNGLAALTLLAAHAAHSLQVLFELINASLDAAAVGFKLGFPRSTGADSAAKLRHGLAPAGEARQQVLKLRQFHLELTLAGAGVAGKDVEDDLGAVENAKLERGLQVAQLRGREIVVEKDQVSLRGGGNACDFLHFTRANERGRIGTVTALQKLGGNLGTGAGHQLAELGQRLFSVQFRGWTARLGRGCSQRPGKSFLRTCRCTSAFHCRTAHAGACMEAHSHQDCAFQPPGILAAGHTPAALISLQSKPLRVRSLRPRWTLPEKRLGEPGPARCACPPGDARRGARFDCSLRWIWRA